MNSGHIIDTWTLAKILSLLPNLKVLCVDELSIYGKHVIEGIGPLTASMEPYKPVALRKLFIREVECAGLPGREDLAELFGLFGHIDELVMDTVTGTDPRRNAVSIPYVPTHLSIERLVTNITGIGPLLTILSKTHQPHALRRVSVLLRSVADFEGLGALLVQAGSHITELVITFGQRIVLSNEGDESDYEDTDSENDWASDFMKKAPLGMFLLPSALQSLIHHPTDHKQVLGALEQGIMQCSKLHDFGLVGQLADPTELPDADRCNAENRDSWQLYAAILDLVPTRSVRHVTFGVDSGDLDQDWLWTSDDLDWEILRKSFRRFFEPPHAARPKVSILAVVNSDSGGMEKEHQEHIHEEKMHEFSELGVLLVDETRPCTEPNCCLRRECNL